MILAWKINSYLTKFLFNWELNPRPNQMSLITCLFELDNVLVLNLQIKNLIVSSSLRFILNSSSVWLMNQVEPSQYNKIILFIFFEFGIWWQIGYNNIIYIYIYLKPKIRENIIKIYNWSRILHHVSKKKSKFWCKNKLCINT